MIFGNENTSKGKILKTRNFLKSYVIFTHLRKSVSKRFCLLSYAIGKCSPLSIFLENKSIAIVFAIRRNNAKEKVRLLAGWVTQ